MTGSGHGGLTNMNISFEIEDKIGVLSQRNTGWSKELNLVNWNKKGVKFDIREWSPDHDKMGKGITMTEDEIFQLYILLKTYFHEETIQKHNDAEQKEIAEFLIKG